MRTDSGRAERPCSRFAPWLFAILAIAFAVLRQPVHAAGPAPQPDQPVRVVTKPLEPFVIENSDGSLSGFSIDLWEEIARRLNLQFEWVEVQSVADQLQAVQDGKADVAIAGISMTPQRESAIDFSHPYFNAGLQILISAEGSRPGLLQLAAAYLPRVIELLVLCLAIAFGMALLIWLYERWVNPQFPRAFLPGISEGLWWFFGVVATGEYADQPTRGMRRLMTVVWWLLGILLVAHVTATLTSTLTVQQLGNQIAGPGDLPGKRVAAVNGTTAATYLAERHIDFTSVPAIQDAYTLLNGGQVDAVVYDAPVLVYYAATEGRGEVEVAGPVFKEETYGIALPTGSPLRELINGALLEMLQDGTYEQIYKNWFRPQE